MMYNRKLVEEMLTVKGFVKTESTENVNVFEITKKDERRGERR